MKRENLTTEYKREYTDDIKKTVMAFANTQGGMLLIGVADDGKIVGVEDVDGTMLKVTNAVRDTIRPDLTMFVLCEPQKRAGKTVITVIVQKGTASPYYLSGKGIRPEGVYVRQGASTVPATESAILKMIKETGGDNYECSRSLQQELSFRMVKKAFAEENLRFGPEQQRTLGIIGEDGAYTNLGRLLSDQCLHIARIAVFEGSYKRVFKDRAEFSGSLLKQLEEIYTFIDRLNRTRAEFSGLKRIDVRDYPPDAVREALLNAIVHRDYAYGASMLISIFDDRIEFVSLGGLPKGIDYSDLMLGVSVLRNNRLADVFYRLHLIEAYGTGIPKIMESYRECREKPAIELSENAFKITLPNRNFKREDAGDKAFLSEADKLILNYLSGHYNVARREIEAATNLSQSKTIRVLKALADRKQVVIHGSGKNTRYSAPER